MKIRNGFVSNSSSSSFVVGLPKPIDEFTEKEFIEMITEGVNKTNRWKDIEERCDCNFSPQRLAQLLYEDLKDKINSKVPEIKTWFYEALGRGLTEYEYVAEYADNENYRECIMEDEFMPQVKYVNNTLSWH